MIELKTNSTNVTVFAPTGETLKSSYDKGYKEGEFAGELSGYAEGKEVGYSEGYGEGYSSGTQAGFSDGHSIGYTNGWDGGYEQGYDTGFIEGESIGKYNGYKDGYDKGMSAGIAGGYQEYYDTIWDYSGVNTNPEVGAVNYDYIFAGGLWNDTTFNPKYDIKPSSQNITGIFHNSKITDLKAILAARGKEMYFLADGNTSKCKYLYTLFAGSTITHIPALKFHARNFEQVFKNCKNLHTIVDAIAEANLENEAELFVVIPNDKKAELRKDEDYKNARNGEVVYGGQVGTIAGIPVIATKATDKAYVMTKEAVKLFIKKDVEVEQDRDVETKTNTVVISSYYVCALVDDSKIVKIGE